MNRRHFIAASAATAFARAADAPRHTVVYRESGKYCGWPANHGSRAWGDEIVAGFEIAEFHFDAERHAVDRSKPAQHVIGRTLDGGESWTVERPSTFAPRRFDSSEVPGTARPVPLDHSINFANANFVLSARMANGHLGPSWFYYSNDRGKTWTGPWHIQDFGQPGVAARTDYLIDSDREMTMFLTFGKSNRREGRVGCVRTGDGGKNWQFLSWIGPELPGDRYAIMPSSVRLTESTIVTAIRRNTDIVLWRSTDNGATWSDYGMPVEQTGRGNPPCMIKLRDGRLALTWGYRAQPYGIRARLSEDGGQTWGKVITLRQDGASWDVGYTRTAQRRDGKLVTVYYFTTKEAPEPFIGATIWTPQG